MRAFFNFLRSLLLRRRAKHQVGASRLLMGLLSRAAIVVGAVVAKPAMAVSDGNVVQGAASINSAGNQTTINQGSDRAVITWKDFNIAPNEAVQFNQPNANSATLNQVIGNMGPTTIQGMLNANGRVFIVDPNGVIFGRGAQVNVGGLVASSLSMSPDSFMSGTNALGASANGLVTGVVNVEAGAQITAKTFVALLSASTVSNAGSIQAGTDANSSERGIAMVAADAATIQLGSFKVTVDKPAMDALVANSGDLVLGESLGDGSIQLNAAGRNALMRTLLSNSGRIQNHSQGAGSTVSLESGGGLSHVGEINAAAGNVSLDGTEIAVDGNITVGTENTETPSLITIGGQATQNVTQGVQSVITANSKVDAQIQIAAQRVLALSGALFAPSGQISLSATILDTGLLVPVADKILLSGVEAWTKLPLKTSDGRVVYYGMDGHVYAEDGQMLDGTTHLYDELDKDVGTVADMDSSGQKKDKGTFYDASTLKLKKIRLSADFGSGNGKLRSIAEKGYVVWVEIAHKFMLMSGGDLFPLTDGQALAFSNVDWGDVQLKVRIGVDGKTDFVRITDGHEQVVGVVVGDRMEPGRNLFEVRAVELSVGGNSVIRRPEGGYDLSRDGKVGLGLDLSVQESGGEVTIAFRQNKDFEILVGDGGRAVVFNKKTQTVISGFNRPLENITDPTGRSVFADDKGKGWVFNSDTKTFDSVDHLVQAGGDVKPNEHGSLEVNADGSLKVFTDGAGHKFAYRIDAAGVKRLMSVQANGDAVDAVSSKAPMQIAVNGKAVSVRATDARKKVLVDATHEQGGEQLFQVLDAQNNPTEQWVTADGKVVEPSNVLARAARGTFEIQTGADAPDAPGTLAKPLALLKNEKGEVVSRVVGVRTPGSAEATPVMVDAAGHYVLPDGSSTDYSIVNVPGFGALIAAHLNGVDWVLGGDGRATRFWLSEAVGGFVVHDGGHHNYVLQQNSQGVLIEVGSVRSLYVKDGALLPGVIYDKDRIDSDRVSGSLDVVLGAREQVLHRKANGDYEPTGVALTFDPTFGSLFLDSTRQIFRITAKGDVIGTGARLQEVDGKTLAIDAKGFVYAPKIDSLYHNVEVNSRLPVINGWSKTEYKAGKLLFNGVSRDVLIDDQGRFALFVIDNLDQLGRWSGDGLGGSVQIVPVSHVGIPGVKTEQLVSSDGRIYQFDDKGNAGGIDYWVKSTALGEVVTRGDVIQKSDGNGGFVATDNKIVRLASGELVVVNQKGDQAIDLNTQTESGDRVVNGKYLIKDISSAAKLANGRPVDKPVYLNADGRIADENGTPLTEGVWSPVVQRVVDETGRPLADARLVTQEGQPVFHMLKGEKGAQVLVAVSEGGLALDSNKLLDKDVFNALGRAFDAAIAKAKASNDVGLKAALEASRRDHTYKTAGELEAALSSYAASKHDVADAQAVALQVTKLNDALAKVPGLSTRLKKFVRPGSAQEKLVALTKDLPVQIEVQKFINELPHDSEADRALVARMNAKAYASEQAARDDLVVQRALRDAITRARLNKDEALAKALMTDEYRTTADIESAVRAYEQSQMVAKVLDAQGLKIADIDARLSRTPGLATRLERLYERGGRNLARVEAAVDEQQKIQTLINELPKAGDAGRAIISRMNARDYASVQEARADLLAQQGGQMVDAEIVKAQVAGNVELAETLKKALAGGVALTPTQAQALLVKVNRAQADMALERAIMQANQAGNIELLKSLMTARGSEMFKTKEQVDVAVREIEQALARAGLTWKAHETVGSMEANAKWSERDESNGEPYKRTPRNPWVNEDRMLVDMYGRVVPVPYLKTESGHYVYRRADGSLTTDIHGGAMPEGEVIVDERERKKRAARAFTPEVNERP